MEQCLRKPDVRKTAKPLPPKPPLKPKDVPPAPPQELGRTQQLIRRIEMAKDQGNGNPMQAETGGRPPVAPPRRAEREAKITDQSDQAPTDDSKQKSQLGAFQKSRKEKTPAFTSNAGKEAQTQDKPQDGSSMKSQSGKQSSFMETLKGFHVEISMKYSSDEETLSEEEQSSESHHPEKHTDPKPEKGNILSGIFRKKTKDSTPSPSLTVSAPDAEPVDEDNVSHENLGVAREVSDSNDSLSESNPKVKEKKGIFGGILRKSPKPSEAEDTQALASELSASNDSLSETAKTTKDKGGIFSGMFKKDPKLSSESGQPHGEEHTLQGKLSVSSDSLSENKEKGNLFSGLLKKIPKAQGDSQEDLSGQRELSASNDSLSEHKKSKEKGGAFSGMFKKTFKHDEPTLNELAASNESLSENTMGNLAGQKELSDSKENLSDTKRTKEKGKPFSGMFRKPNQSKPVDTTQPEEAKEKLSQNSDVLASNESSSETKEKGGLFGVILKKNPKATGDVSEDKEGDKKLPASHESLSEGNAVKEKHNFGGIFKKPQKPTHEDSSDGEESNQPKEDISAIFKNLSEATTQKEKGGLFGGLLKKTPKAIGDGRGEKDVDKEITASNDSLSEGNPAKEKSIFGGIFKMPQKPTQEDGSDREGSSQHEHNISASCENLSTQKEKKPGFSGLFKRTASIDNLDHEEKGGLFGGLLKKTPKATGDASEEKDGVKEITASNDSLSEGNAGKDKNIFGGIFKKPQRPTQEDSSDREGSTQPEEQKSSSCENLSETTTQKEKKGGLSGLFKRAGSIDNLNDNEEKSIFSGIFKKPAKALEGSTADEDIEGKLSVSGDELSETAKEKTGGISGMFKRSPKPAPRSLVATDPLHDTNELGESDDENPTLKETRTELSASNDSLNEVSTTKERMRAFGGMFKKTPKAEEQQDNDESRPLGGGRGLKRRKTITRKKRVVSFRVKRTLPRTAKSSDLLPLLEEESVEMKEMTPIQEGSVEIQNVEMAAYPTEENNRDAEENDELMEWWNGVVGWAEWNETSNFQEEDEEEAVEQAADRLFMAARLFVRIFNQRGASLQQRILELLAQADAADQFHKRTVSAAVGGGVASVAGSVATITGLILAPFTFGASIIVTAVGISVATAGSIASATANITDAVHSNMDRKKVEKMIQGYQDEMQDISECLAFVQEGMVTLQEWDFEKYSQSAAKKALNHNIKHVIKEGGRAGKALVIKTNELISTVQVLGAAGGAAKAAQAISVTTGVMSALFLALDVFFLAKDSHELRKGAKTKFAKKIREVCKELQAGLLELNKVKSQLQKTMDGIELEEVEEILEVEEEVEEEESGDELESDPVKLAQMYEELDVMEEKLDKRAQEEKEQKERAQREKEQREKEEAERAQREKEQKEKEMKEKEEKERAQREKKEREEKERVQREKERKEKEKEKKEKAAKELKGKEAGEGKEEKRDEEEAENEKAEAGSGGEQQEKNKKSGGGDEEGKEKEQEEDNTKSAKGTRAQSERERKRESAKAESATRPLSQKEPLVPGGKRAKEAENRATSQREHALGEPAGRGEAVTEDHGRGKSEKKEKDGIGKWLGGLLRGGGEEAKSGPEGERPTERREEKLSVEPKESGAETRGSAQASRHNSGSSSGGSGSGSSTQNRHSSSSSSAAHTGTHSRHSSTHTGTHSRHGSSSSSSSSTHTGTHGGTHSRHSSSSSTHTRPASGSSNSTGRSERDRARGPGTEAREGHSRTRGDGSKRRDDGPAAGREKTGRGGERAEVRRRESERSRDEDESAAARRGRRSGTAHWIWTREGEGRRVGVEVEVARG